MSADLKSSLSQSNTDWFWLRLYGPDGYVWMMGHLTQICGEYFFNLPEDSREMEPLRFFGDEYHLHKWTVVQVFPCRPPENGSPAWTDPKF